MLFVAYLVFNKHIIIYTIKHNIIKKQSVRITQAYFNSKVIIL